MKTSGEIIIDAVIRAAAVESAVQTDGAIIFLWSANAAEQIEAAIREAGYELRPNAPWSAQEIRSAWNAYEEHKRKSRAAALACSASAGHRWQDVTSDGNKQRCCHCGKEKFWCPKSAWWVIRSPNTTGSGTPEGAR